MKVLVKYVDHHEDNYQGGSGKSFEFSTLIEMPLDLKINEIIDYIKNKIFSLSKMQRPYSQNESYPAIKEINIYE